MKKIKRLLALLLLAVMVLSMAGCHKNKSVEDETTGDGGNKPTEITVNLHYLRDDGNYAGWNTWFWTTGDGAQSDFGKETDDKGAMCSATFPAGTESVGFIVRLNEWEEKDVESDRFIDTSSILAGTVDVYVTSGKEEFETVFGDDCVTGMGVTVASMSDDFTVISVFLTEEWTDKNTIKVLDADGKEVKIKSTDGDEKNKKLVKLTLESKADEFGTYSILLNESLKYPVSLPDIYSMEAFEKEYTYDGDDLGAEWSKDATTFKVWAPTADAVSLNLYKGGDASKSDLIKSVDMTAGDNGTWSVKVEENLNGTYYTYTASFGKEQSEACDPYAKAVGVNGDRAMVIDLASTNPDGWDKDSNPNSGMEYTDASVYEVHVRDISSDSSSGIKNVGKYLGLIETGTVNSNGIATGLDHIKELGVTHIQLNPVYDYATVDESKLDSDQFNWGYDPKNYNVPEGSYSTDPYNGDVRISEFKQMVEGLHNNGLSVVMDVVYNHTYSTDFCFNKLVPDYFYRPGSNGSGCGNDVASERSMVRKYIVESVVYWATEYHIDGFRFDLVGLIDTETIKEIRAALDKIDPSIILYGEGWSMSTLTTKENTYLAVQSQAGNLEGFGMFNDSIRDAIKGSVFNETEKGYINGDFSKASVIQNSMMGKTGWSSSAYQLINYASCHDNMTLWDEINSSNPDDSLEDRIKQNLLSASIVYTSQGVPFILAGEEMLRTKTNDDGSFNNNSYSSPDSVNSIKWDTLNDADYMKVFNYYKGLIAFRKAHASLTMMTDTQKYYTFSEGLDDGVIAYELAPCEGENGIFGVYNAGSKATTVTLPEGNWTIYVQDGTAGTTSLGTASGSVTVNPISCTILVKE